MYNQHRHFNYAQLSLFVRSIGIDKEIGVHRIGFHYKHRLKHSKCCLPKLSPTLPLTHTKQLSKYFSSSSFSAYPSAFDGDFIVLYKLLFFNDLKLHLKICEFFFLVANPISRRSVKKKTSAAILSIF